MPIVTMIAGPNGSGKSTLIAKLQAAQLLPGEYLNADDLAKTMEGDAVTVAAESQQVVRDRRATALVEKRDHCFETVMSHTSHIDHMKAARANGFETRLYFVATEGPAINKSRVRVRVNHGGHDVPIDRIESRYYRSLANLPLAISACDSSIILDNSDVARGFRPMAEVRLGKIRHLAGADPDVIPFWWLKILEQIMPGSLLSNGKILKLK